MSASVAIATCAEVDIDPDAPLLLDALLDLGVPARQFAWDDPGVAWEDHGLTVIRSTWDYAPRRDEFVAWARARARLWNAAEAVAYSTDKHYLAGLVRAGIPVIPTQFVDVGTMASLGRGPLVVKPAVGAGSILAERFDLGDVAGAGAHVAALHAMGRDALVQPYVSSIDDEGETALVFIDGTFSHAMRKAAMLHVRELDRTSTFRREQMSLISVDESTIDLGSRVLAATGFADLLYARVDLVRHGDIWAVMEVELVEPSLFLSFVPEAAPRLARAIRARLDGRPPR